MKFRLVPDKQSVYICWLRSANTVTRYMRSSIENLTTVAIALRSCAQVSRLNRLNALSSSARQQVVIQETNEILPYHQFIQFRGHFQILIVE